MKTSGSGAATDKYAGVSTAAIAKATGRGWAEWARILDRAGARKLSHKDIAKWLRANHGDALSAWWCQMITVGYEQKRGLRAVGQKSDGFSANASRTLATAAATAYAALSNSRKRKVWLGLEGVKVTSAAGSQTLNLIWPRPESRVAITIHAKGTARCAVSVDHSRLPNSESRNKMKEFWRDRLSRLPGLIKP